MEFQQPPAVLSSFCLPNAQPTVPTTPLPGQQTFPRPILSVDMMVGSPGFVFDPDMSSDVVSGPYSSRQACTPVESSLRTISVMSETGHGTLSQHKGLERPTRAHWKLWKSDILARYEDESANAIVARLRREGYQVTVKMLRDRFREWGANTKARKAQEVSALIPIMDRPISTSTSDAQQRQFLQEVSHWLDCAWKTGDFHAPTRPQAHLLQSFIQVYRVANRQGTDRAWRCVHQLSNVIAQTDWSTIAPSNFTALVRETVWVATSKQCRALVEKPIWKSMLTKMLPPTHPIALFLELFLDNHDKADLTLWHALSELEHSKVRMYKPREQQAQDLALSRMATARILSFFHKNTEVDRILQRYMQTGEDGELTNVHRSALCDIFYILGQSSFSQGHFEKAAMLFRNVQSLDELTDINFTVNNANWLADSLVQAGKGVEAKNVLLDLVKYLQAEADAHSLYDEALALRIAYRLKTACDRFAAVAGLEYPIQQLRALPLAAPEETNLATSTPRPT